VGVSEANHVDNQQIAEHRAVVGRHLTMMAMGRTFLPTGQKGAVPVLGKGPFMVWPHDDVWERTAERWDWFVAGARALYPGLDLLNPEDRP
jgi:hypothetical protein